MRPIEADLGDIGPGLFDEGEVFRVRVLRPVGDEGGELESPRLVGACGLKKRREEASEE
jgi:hypothetical protein